MNEKFTLSLNKIKRLFNFNTYLSIKNKHNNVLISNQLNQS